MQCYIFTKNGALNAPTGVTRKRRHFQPTVVSGTVSRSFARPKQWKQTRAQTWKRVPEKKPWPLDKIKPLRHQQPIETRAGRSQEPRRPAGPWWPLAAADAPVAGERSPWPEETQRVSAQRRPRCVCENSTDARNRPQNKRRKEQLDEHCARVVKVVSFRVSCSPSRHQRRVSTAAAAHC